MKPDLTAISNLAIQRRMTCSSRSKDGNISRAPGQSTAWHDSTLRVAHQDNLVLRASRMLAGSQSLRIRDADETDLLTSVSSGHCTIIARKFGILAKMASRRALGSHSWYFRRPRETQKYRGLPRRKRPSSRSI
jgi:hypothetical protein